MADTPGATFIADTRRRLLQAALKAFGHRDYDAVSTREIVDSADANISAISYHFGGKRGLYLATAEYLAQTLHLAMQDRLQQITGQLPGADPDRCREMLGELISGFVETLLTGELGEDAPGFIFREQSQPSGAFDVLYGKLFEPMHRSLSALVGRARNLPADSDEVRMAAHGLLGQAIAFRAARTSLLRHLARPAYSDADLQRIKALTAAMSRAALDYAPLETDHEH